MMFCSRATTLTAGAVLILASAACSNGVPLGPSAAATQAAAAGATTPTTATPTPTPTPTPTTPATTVPATTAVAYTDLAPIFASDCTPCHGARPAGHYSTATYAGVMAGVRAGSASSALVFVTQPGGAMYGFLSGDRAAKAALIRTWVLNGAPQTR